MSTMIVFLTYATFFLVFVAIFATIALGLNLQWGFTGLFNVGVAGFVAIGAYTSAILTAPDYPNQLGGFGLPIILGWLGAMLAAGIAALIVGIAALRLRHDYLAITTFGIAITLQLVALNAQFLTGGAFGLQFIPKPFESLFGAAWRGMRAISRSRCSCSAGSIGRWSGWCAAPGAACCARFARTRSPRRRSASAPSSFACNPSSSAA